MSSTMSDVQKILVSLSTPEVVVEPGGTAQLLVTMTNQQDTPDRLSLEVEGVDVEWYAIPVPAVNLAPATQASERILFKLARTSENRAGTYPFLVRVQAMETGATGIAQATLVVKPFSSLQVELNPKRAVATFFGPLNDFDVTIANQGNADETLDLYASDPEDGCAYEFDTDRITLKPGISQVVPLAIRPKILSILGGMRLYGFTVSARSVEDSYVSANAHGQVEKHALISPLLGIFLLLLLFGGAGWWIFRPKPTLPAKLNRFDASSLRVDSGQDVVLSWDVANAQQIIIYSKVGKENEVAKPGEQKPDVGTIDVKPTYPQTTYRIDVRGGGRDKTKSITIFVNPLPTPPKPVLDSFVADPPVIHQGESVTLMWKGRNAREYILDPGNLHLSRFEETHVVTPDQDNAAYQLRAIPQEDTINPVSKTVKIHVVPKDKCIAEIDKLVATPESAYIGDRIRLKWKTRFAKTLHIDADKGSPIGDLTSAAGSVDVTLTDTTVFTLTATDSLGLTTTKTVTVVGKERPPVSVTPNPTKPPDNNGTATPNDAGTGTTPAPGTGQ